MPGFKCKVCGGTIEFELSATVGVCDCCGTRQTLPKTSENTLISVFNRANNLRLKCEFDKAAALYEKIVEQDDSEAEAHWGLVLCKYGIEYVDDPATGKKIPTCHRTLFEAVTADADYQAALDYSDVAQQVIYETEARTIDRIQKDILAIVKNEKPFDVFICYKETDENGKRTQDSVIANDIYYQLTQEGFKVFYAAITLEDKLGQEYEPYIFAALNSAKVMLVVGTNPMYFNAVWVRNEWSRYLKLMKTDRTKLLIPCYRDMDAYELPEEFAHLQAQDMSKIGFINDIVRGIKKVIAKEVPIVSNTMTTHQSAKAHNDIASLIGKVELCLEDSEFEKADEFCEEILNLYPKCAEAYLGKLMAELKIKSRDSLKDCIEPIDQSNNYNKVMRFGSDELKTEVSEIAAYIVERNENQKKKATYESALRTMDVANSEETFKAAVEMFKNISGYRDADDLAEKCIEKAEICKKKAEIEEKESIYAEGKELMNQASYSKAIQKFQTISGWKDTEELITVSLQKIEVEKERQEREEKARVAAAIRTKKINKARAAVTLAFVLLITFIILLVKVIIPEVKINNAQKLMDNGEYESACLLLKNLNYKDSNDKINEIVSLKPNLKIYFAVVGDTVTFGNLEWKVLEINGTEVLLITKDIVTKEKYKETYTAVTWESCTLRSWLNSTFLTTYIPSEAERAKIITSTVVNDDNPSYGTEGGNTTKDKVFLLSIAEAKVYLTSISDYIAKYHGVTCWWWRRSPGGNSYSAAVGDDNGYCVTQSGGVRPAMWVNLGS